MGGSRLINWQCQRFIAGFGNFIGGRRTGYPQVENKRCANVIANSFETLSHFLIERDYYGGKTQADGQVPVAGKYSTPNEAQQEPIRRIV